MELICIFAREKKHGIFVAEVARLWNAVKPAKFWRIQLQESVGDFHRASGIFTCRRTETR